MPVAGAPVTISAGQTVGLTPPIRAAAGQTWQVELDNLSPFTLSVRINGQAVTLPPSVMRLTQTTSGPIDVSVTVPPSSDTGTYQLLSTWAVLPDSIQGTLPASVGLTTISGPVTIDSVTGAVTLEAGTAVLNAGDVEMVAFPTTAISTTTDGQTYTSPAIPLPAGSQSCYVQLEALAVAGETGLTIEVLGVTTGNLYISATTSEIYQSGVFYPVLIRSGSISALDSEVLVEITAGASTFTANLTVVTTTGPLTPPTTPGFPISTVPLGGLFATGDVTIAANSMVTLLPVPPAGLAYRLHRWGHTQEGSLIAIGYAQPPAFTFNHISVLEAPNPGTGADYITFSESLNGLCIAGAQIQMHQGNTVADIGYLFYDLVKIPMIQ